MWRVSIALVLVLSFSLVMAVPVSAGDPTVAITAGGGIDDLTGAPTGSGTEAGEHSIAITDATASTLTGDIAESAATEDTMLTALVGTEVLTVTIAGEEVTTAALASATADTTTLAVVAADIEAKINAATTIADVTVVATVTGGLSNDYFVITVVPAGVNNSVSEVTGDGATPTHLGGETPVAGTDAKALDTFTAATGSNGLWVADTNYGDGGTTMTITHTTTAGTASTLEGLGLTAPDAFIEGVTLTASGDLSAGTAVVTVSEGTAGYLVVTGAAASMIAGDETNELTVTAYDDAGNLATAYAGAKDLTFSGPSVAPDGTVPSVEATDIGEVISVAFTLGASDADEATLIVKAVEATTVDVSDGTIDSSADSAYDLDLFVEGINLDSEGYRTDATVTVTVGDESLAGVGTTGIVASGTVPVNDVSVALTETPAVDGIFIGTFTLVDTSPGSGELLVGEGSAITVTYPNDAGLEVPPLNQATVDDVSPVFAEVEPVGADATHYKNGGTIILTADIGEIDLTVTADFSYVDSEYTADDETVMDNGNNTYTITYTISVDNTMADGLYTIPVTAEDVAENSATDDSCSVALDNTAPAVTDPKSDPVVIQPDIATDVTFTASVSDGEGSGVDTVTVDLESIGGAADQVMSEVEGIYTYLLAGLDVAIEDEGTYYLVITATDVLDNVNATANITLNVIADAVDPVFTSTAAEYPVGYESARPEEDVTITAVVTDDLAGVKTVTVDATDIDCGATEALSPTEVADTYSATLTVAAGTAVDTYTLTITATDYAANAATANVTVEVVAALTAYNIWLDDGWNLVSMPLIQSDSPEVILAGLSAVGEETIPDILSVWGYDPDDGWLSYFPGGPPPTLTQMTDGCGYWIDVEYAVDAPDAFLTIHGTEQPLPGNLPPTYDVVTGWNLIGYKVSYPESANVYLAGITDSVVRIYGFDDGNYSVVELAENMFSGFGYWLAMSESGTIYP